MLDSQTRALLDGPLKHRRHVPHAVGIVKTHDVKYLEQMYAYGGGVVKNYYDVLGAHLTTVDGTKGVHAMIPKKLFVNDKNDYWYEP